VTPEYPAVADFRVVAALVEAARAAGARCRAGVTWSLDAFYARNARAGDGDALASMCFGGYRPPALETRIREMQAARVLNCEMEAGALLTLAGLFGLRAGAICVVSDRTPWRPGEAHDPQGQAPGALSFDLDRNMTTAIAVAHAAVARLAREDP
jgi:uridine phosphorylase